MNVATLAKSGDLIKILEVGKICRRPYPKPCLVLMGRAERSAYQDLRHDNPSPGESAVVEHEMDHVWPVGSFVIRLDSILRGTKGCKYSVNILKANFMQFGIVCCERAHRGGYQLTRITWSQIRICPVTAARFHPRARPHTRRGQFPVVRLQQWKYTMQAGKNTQNKCGSPWLDYALSFADSYPKIGSG